MSQASYPNEGTFQGTSNFCFLLKKLMTSCNNEKTDQLDLKFPNLCAEVIKEAGLIGQLDCNIFEDESGSVAIQNKTNVVRLH